MMRRLGFTAILLIVLFSAFRYANPTPHSPPPLYSGEINWMSFEEALQAMKTDQKKVLIDIYTEWCGWCKHMDKTTYRDSHIVQYINQHFYAVKFDAEQKQDIDLGSKVYESGDPSSLDRRYHQLAESLTMGRLTLPSTVFLNENFEILQPIPGYRDPKTFEMIMTYYGDNHYTRTPWTVYKRYYVPLKKKMEPVLIAK